MLKTMPKVHTTPAYTTPARATLYGTNPDKTNDYYKTGRVTGRKLRIPSGRFACVRMRKLITHVTSHFGSHIPDAAVSHPMFGHE
eukprot:gene21145-7958_t